MNKAWPPNPVVRKPIVAYWVRVRDETDDPTWTYEVLCTEHWQSVCHVVSALAIRQARFPVQYAVWRSLLMRAQHPSGAQACEHITSWLEWKCKTFSLQRTHGS